VSSHLRFAAALLAVVCFAGVSSCATSASAGSTAATVWLCRPGLRHDPCTASLRTTVIGANGSTRIVDYQAASHPAVDCFYVYPLVTTQTTPNANLQIQAQETAIAELEASPFSRVCRIFAPMYREVTLAYVDNAADEQIAYDSVLSAWQDYLAHYNDGRGVILIGHSEGADQLTELLAAQINNDPAVRRLLISAILTGTNHMVTVHGAGPFSNIGTCDSPAQTGCVVAYNAYAGTPPASALFGVTTPAATAAGGKVACTNPASLAGGTGALQSQYRLSLPTQDVPGSSSQGVILDFPAVSTPWIQFNDQYQASCVYTDGASVLSVTAADNAPTLTTYPSAAWGLHVDDPNLALGNLVQLAQSQTIAYIGRHR
jgi:hypothetical protein